MIKDWMNPLLPIETRLEIADGEINRLNNQIDRLIGVLNEFIELDDWFRDQRNEHALTHEGAYLAYYKGQYELWERARLLAKKY